MGILIVKEFDIHIDEHLNASNWNNENVKIYPWVDASYDGSFLWRNDIFFMGTLYLNAYGD